MWGVGTGKEVQMIVRATQRKDWSACKSEIARSSHRRRRRRRRPARVGMQGLGLARVADDDAAATIFHGEKSDWRGSATLDAKLLYGTRCLRQFAFGCSTVVLFVLLGELGLEGGQIGVLLTCIMAGDLVLTLVLTTVADQCGRRRTLIAGSVLALLGALAFGTSADFTLLVVAGTICVISPSGKEVGPFLAVEQAALADLQSTNGGVAAIAASFGKYQAVGEIAKAVGSLAAGRLTQAFACPMASADAPAGHACRLAALRLPLVIFGVLSLCKAILYALCSPRIEAAGSRAAPREAGEAEADREHGGYGGAGALTRRLPCCASLSPASRRTVLQLSSLFALDAFAGGFIMLSWTAFWFRARWALDFGALGALLACASAIAGMSGMLAGRLVARFGAVETMVYTHLPSNLMLMLVPLMPTATAAAAVLIARYAISECDVPARQAYVAWLVRSDERSAAGGITAIARSLGVACSPLLLGGFTSAAPGSARFDAPFYVAGALKVVYDLTVWRHFRSGASPEDDRAALAPGE